MEPKEIIGHTLSLFAVILSFLSYQMRTKKGILLVQSAATLLTAVQYLLLGGISGCALNAVCLIRNFCFYHRDKKFFSGPFFPIFFACMMPIVSIFSWDGYRSLLIIAGLTVNTLALGFCTPQGLRRSILTTCPLIILYNVFVGSYMSILLECLAMVSAIIGLVRYAKNRSGTNAGAVSEGEPVSKE